MIKNEWQEMRSTALNVRERFIRMSGNGGCFICASLSCVELMLYCCTRVIRRCEDLWRDYLFLSKGHDVPALYGTFAELGLLDPDRLANHLSTEDHIYWH